MYKNLENKRVLVTGAAGFIGSNLVEKLLANNVKVVGLDNFATGKRENIALFAENKNFDFIEGDIRNTKICEQSVENVQVVLHQAALGSVPRSIADPITSTEVNITGFVNMLTAAKNAGIKRFVYAASSSTYGDHKELPKIEERIGKPLSPYAITKYVNELYAQNFSTLYGIETIGLRYFNVFGKRQDPNGAYAAVIPKFIKLLLEHKAPLIHGDGLQSRDFTYIDNVVQMNVLAATTENTAAVNTVYNVAFGENTSLNELYELLRTYLSEFDEVIRNIVPLFGEERLGDVKHSLASIEKARNLLNYNPVYNIKDGLKEAIKWYYENLSSK